MAGPRSSPGGVLLVVPPPWLFSSSKGGRGSWKVAFLTPDVRLLSAARRRVVFRPLLRKKKKSQVGLKERNKEAEHVFEVSLPPKRDLLKTAVCLPTSSLAALTSRCHLRPRRRASHWSPSYINIFFLSCSIECRQGIRPERFLANGHPG